MQVTPARPTDLPDIKRMIAALAAFHSDTATMTLSALQVALFDSGRACAFVARDGADCIGYAGVSRMIVLQYGTERLDIQHLYVAEHARSNGVGRALIAAVREWAIAQNADALTIGTDPENAAAIAAYRAMGLPEITGAGPRFRIWPEAQP